MTCSSATLAATLPRCEHGVATVEYVIVLALLSLGAALAVFAAGALLFQLLSYQTHLLLLPIP